MTKNKKLQCLARCEQYVKNLHLENVDISTYISENRSDVESMLAPYFSDEFEEAECIEILCDAQYKVFTESLKKCV